MDSKNGNTTLSNNSTGMGGDKLWIPVFICVFLGLMVDGMDLLFLSFSLGSLAKEFNMTPLQEGSLGSITLVGMAIGGMFGGWASDRYGRVHTLTYTIVVFSIGTAALALSQNYHQFAVIRFISSLGLGAEYVVANTLMAEYVPTKHRTTVLGTVQAGWSVGYLLAAIIAAAVLPAFGWRYLFLISIIPVGLAVYIRHKIPEPASWLRQREFIKNGGESAKRTQKYLLWIKLAKEPKFRATFIAWSFTATFLQFGYFGLNNWLPRYIESEVGVSFRSMAMYMVGTYAAMILGKVIAGYLADKFGRKLIFVSGCVGTALFLPVVIFFHSPANVIILLTMFGFLYGVPYGVNATYMTESFDTEIRGTAVGTAYNIGRIGATLAPLTIGYIATSHSIGYGFLIMGVAYLLTGIVPALFIKEKMYNPYQS